MRNGLKRIMAILIATLILLGALPASALETESSNVVVPGIDLASELDSADQPAVIAGEVDIADGAEITLTVEDEVTVRSVAEDRNSDRNHQERWSSSDATIAAVVGQHDSAYSYAQTNATITAVAPGAATITHHYWTRTSNGWGYTWSEQTETITVNVQPAPQPCTVTFNVGAAAEGGVTAPDPIVVMENQTVPSLPTLEWRDESGEIVMIFAGWYSNEGLTTEFTENTPVTGDITLYARWVEEDTDGFYYVNFYSQDAQTVHLTMAVTEGRTVGEPDGPVLTDKVFVGWSMTQQGTSPADALDAFDFYAPVSDVAVDGTLNLYAWYADAIEVRFVANGGTAVPTQTIATGSTATKPTTTRTGYTFLGWSTDAETFEPFNFATPLAEDTTLYAFWEANMVRVTLVYMYENANDDGYSPAGYSETVYAPAGSYVSIEQKGNITNTRATHDVRYADSDGGELRGYAKTSETGGSNAIIEDVRGSYFQYHSATNNRLVMPNGSTVVLVYYNRARITLNFDYDQNNARGSIDYEDLISAANRDKYQVSYTQISATHFTYSFTAKYGQDITAVWPQPAWVRNSNGNTPSYSDWSGTYTFYAWERPDDEAQSS
ncbi:MAG TPA: InlB B-repeat-containing protein, partial [Candidatus Faecivicinus avistercoris]|nr:InlB B-repeat-containing protein [Candidatus Faecivicinus avistercoris]